VSVKLTKGHRFIEVNRTKDDKARDLIGKRRKNLSLSISDSLTLACRLEYLPVALSQAVVFMQESNLDINEYLQFLKDDTTLMKLLDGDFEADGRDANSLRALIKTWTESFRKRSPFLLGYLR
jgi:hypothetical protein